MSKETSRCAPKAIAVAALTTLLALATESTEANSVVFAENTITGCCIANPPGQPVWEFFNNSTTASFSGFPTQSFSDPHLLDHAQLISVDAKEATSGPGPFPSQNDFTGLAGIALGMKGARADAISTSQDPSVDNWMSVTEVRTTSGELASASSNILESATFDVPEGLSLRFFLKETYRFFIATSGETVNASIHNRYALAGPDSFYSRSSAPLSCTASGSSGFCDTGTVDVVFPELETGPLKAGRYTLSFESLTAVSVVPEPQIALLMLGGLAAIAFARRLRT